MPFQRKGATFNESLVIGRDTTYPYRTGLGMLPSAEYNYFFEDFNNLITSNLPATWQAAIIDTSATLTNLTSTAENGGIARVTPNAASEGVAIYRPRTIVLSGKRFYMEALVRTNNITDSEIQIGLSVLTATTNPEDLYTTAADSFVTFGIVDGAATGVLTYDKSNAGPQTDSAASTTAALVVSTWTTIGLSYNGSTTAGVGSITGWINGNPVIKNTVAAKVPDTIQLAPFFGARAGDGAVRLIDIDYFRYAIQR